MKRNAIASFLIIAAISAILSCSTASGDDPSETDTGDTATTGMGTPATPATGAETPDNAPGTTTTDTGNPGTATSGGSTPYTTTSGASSSGSPSSETGAGASSDAAADATVTLSVIPGIVVPVRGASPVTASIETAQYTGTVSWNPADDPFAALTVYTATVSLAAKAGFTLSGIGENFFTVAGATATNDAGSGIVKAAFPATGKVPDIEVAFLGATQSGGSFAASDTTALTLSFDADPTALTADNITVTGATKGALSGTGLTRTLAISDISVMNGATVSVTVASPSGFAVSGSPRTARVFRAISVGMDFLGGKVGYLLQEGDPGYDPDVSHGLIVARFDEAVNYPWAVDGYQHAALPGATGTAIGTGRANTELIVAQNGAGTNYAAGLARAYSGGGYSDWYLPSRDELLAVIKNRGAIGMNLNCYKSSSEYDADQAYVVWLDEYLSYENKSGGRKVCAVRDF